MRDGWEKVAISDVCIMIKRGQAPSYTENKSVTVLNQKCIRDGRINLEFSRQTDANLKPVNEWAYLNATDTLVNSTGVGTLGRVAFVRNLPEPTTVDSHVTIVRPDNKKVEPSFLGLSLNFREADIEGLAAGSSGQTELSREALGNLIITLPTLPEQKRIVDLISSVDSYIKALQQQLESAKRSRNAVLHELLNAGGEDWVETTLGEICTEGLFADGDWVESKDQDPEGEYRLLQLADIGDGTFLNKSDRWMNREQFNRLGCTKLEVNDVLIARMPDPIGRACLFPEGLPVCATVVDVAIVRTGNETLQKFLALLINSSDFRTEAFSLLTGTTRQRISRGNLAKISFAIPSSEKQLEIVNLISLFDVEIAQSVRVIEEAKQLRSGLLNELLSGEHEIPATYDKVMGAA